MGTTVLIDDRVIASLLSELPRAALLGHSGRSFLEHLVCTWRLLSDWRMPRTVCRAGFMHSVYSTSAYPHALFCFEERTRVRQLIGRGAEELVFHFCSMDRRGFWDRLTTRRDHPVVGYRDRLHEHALVRVDRELLQKLLIIESANVAEQAKAADGGPAPWMSRLLGWWTYLDERWMPPGFRSRPTLTRRADEAAIRAYRRALSVPARQAIGLLDHAIRQNPWAGEPRILRALCSLESDDCAAARVDAGRGAALISAWAVAWDKRLSASGWSVLAARIQRATQKQRFARLDYTSACAMLARTAPRPRGLSGVTRRSPGANATCGAAPGKGSGTQRELRQKGRR